MKLCLDYLARALLVTPPDSSSRLIVSRSVSLLKSFLHGFRHRPVRRKKFTLKINPSKEFRMEGFEVSMSGIDTVGKLRQEVFDKLVVNNMGISLSSTELVWDAKRLVANNMLLRDIGFKYGDEIFVRRPQSMLVLTYDPEEPQKQSIPTEYPRISLANQPNASSAKDNEGKVEQLNRHSLGEASLEKIASDPKSFERLFDLLSPGSPIGEEVWDILMLLPTNK